VCFKRTGLFSFPSFIRPADILPQHSAWHHPSPRCCGRAGRCSPERAGWRAGCAVPKSCRFCPTACRAVLPA